MARLSNSLKNLLYHERFVNDGSPTGLTFTASSSTPTSPLHCPGSFRLPFVLVPKQEVRTIGDEWQKAFPEIAQQAPFPVHPDLIDSLAPNYHKQVVWQPRLVQDAIPTASPRTVFIFDVHQRPCCLKLDYPLVLGRFSSELTGEKLWVGPRISMCLASMNSEQNIYFLPEIDAIEAVVFADGRRSGAILRLCEVWSTNGPVKKQLKLLPAFSLFSLDKLEPKKKPLIAELLQRTKNPTDELLHAFIEPLLRSYWSLSLNYGLIPEAHAQNFLFGFDLQSLSLQPLVIWRDFQGFFRDEARIPQPLAKTEIGVYHILEAKRAVEAQQRRSFLYDWILGHYSLDPLIAVAQLFCNISVDVVQDRIIEITRNILNEVESGYLPKNEWYSMSLEPPQGQYFSMIVNKNPKYR